MVRESKLISIRNPKSTIAEEYRTLRTNIQFSGVDKVVRTLVVTSALASEGKTTTVSNLAAVEAQAGRKVLMIDTDLRRPKLYKTVQVSNKRGLTDLLLDYNKDKIEMFTQSVPNQDNLFILPTGPLPPNPSELLGSQKMTEFLKDAVEIYDKILLDTPPIGIVTDAAVLSSQVDGTILVIAHDNANIDVVHRAKKLLDNVGTNIIGSVMTKMPATRGYYKYNYYHAYYGETDAPKKRRSKTFEEVDNVG